MNDIAIRQNAAPNAFRAESIESAWRISEGLSKSELVPEIYKNKPYNVMIAIMCGQELGVNPFTVMQHMSVIKGKPRWEVKFLIAMANRSGVFSIPIDWKVHGSGDSLAVEAYATLKASGVTVSCSVSLAEAKADGWANNPKYRTIPELMLRYRSAGRLIDLYCPEVRLGLSSDAEVEPDAEATQEPQTPVVAVLPPAEPRRPGRPRKVQPASFPIKIEGSDEPELQIEDEIDPDFRAAYLEKYTKFKELSERLFKLRLTEDDSKPEIAAQIQDVTAARTAVTAEMAEMRKGVPNEVIQVICGKSQ